ncbi:MAG: hypothetical protein WDM88_12185 [Galbitalea sp.]
MTQEVITLQFVTSQSLTLQFRERDGGDDGSGGAQARGTLVGRPDARLEHAEEGVELTCLARSGIDKSLRGFAAFGSDEPGSLAASPSLRNPSSRDPSLRDSCRESGEPRPAWSSPRWPF